MGFEFFRESGRGYRPRASIRKQGQIGLNQGAVKRFEIEGGDYVILGFDKDAKKVALKVTKDSSEKGAQKIVVKDGSASISAKSFLEYFEIGYQDETRQYDVNYDDESKLIVIDIGGSKDAAAELIA